MKVVDDVLAGCRITGDLGTSGIFHPRLREAEVCLEDIWRAASRSRAALAYGMRPSRCPEDDRELFQLTLDEVSAGKAAGPFTAEELDARLGPCWVAARRFAVRQGAKLRAVDDFSEFCINQTVTSREVAASGGVDAILAMSRAWFVEPDEAGRVSFPGVLYAEVPSPLHPDFAGKRGDLLGKCKDLSDAFKQLAVSPADESASVIAVYDPASQAPRYFETWSMPFGATAAVSRFNRMSAALEYILSRSF